MLTNIRTRLRLKLAAFQAALRPKYEVIIYINGAFTNWQRPHTYKFVEPFPGVRIPMDVGPGMMPRPDARDVLQTKCFRSQKFAMGWIRGRLHGFDTSKIVGEVRPL